MTHSLQFAVIIFQIFFYITLRLMNIYMIPFDFEDFHFCCCRVMGLCS